MHKHDWVIHKTHETLVGEIIKDCSTYTESFPGPFATTLFTGLVTAILTGVVILLVAGISGYKAPVDIVFAYLLSAHGILFMCLSFNHLIKFHPFIYYDKTCLKCNKVTFRATKYSIRADRKEKIDYVRNKKIDVAKEDYKRDVEIFKKANSG